MIPDFMTLKTQASKSATLMPHYFRPAVGVTAVTEVPYRAGHGKPTAAQKAGLRYEAKWHRFARQLWGAKYRTFEEVQLKFRADDGWRTCRPDGVLVTATKLYLFEVKIRHTADAWWQMHHLYVPVLQAMTGRKVVCTEVCRHVDPQVLFPGSICFVTAPQLPFEAEPPKADTLIIRWSSQG